MPTCRTTRGRRELNANVSNDAGAKGTQRQRVERRGSKDTETKGPNANMSNDVEAEETQCHPVERHGGERGPTPTCRTTRGRGTQRQRIERHGGEGGPTPTRPMMRRRKDPAPTRRKTRRRRGPKPMCRTAWRRREPSYEWSRAAWLCSSFLLIPMYIHTSPRRTTPPWGQYIHLVHLCVMPNL